MNSQTYIRTLNTMNKQQPTSEEKYQLLWFAMMATQDLPVRFIGQYIMGGVLEIRFAAYKVLLQISPEDQSIEMVLFQDGEFVAHLERIERYDHFDKLREILKMYCCEEAA